MRYKGSQTMPSERPIPSMSGHLSEITAQGRVLIVEDDEAALNVLARILTKAGFGNVRGLADSRLVLPELRTFEPDLLLLDLRMPHLDGFVVLRQVRNRIPVGEFFPILVISGNLEEDTKQRALSEGAT